MLIAGTVLLASCSFRIGTDDSEPTSAPATSASEAAGTDAGLRDDDLGISFDLPESFSREDDPELAFLARSNQPRSIFSIGAEVEDAPAHEAEPGERLSELDLGTGGATLIDNAAVDGLPPGIEAKMLLVDNGPSSFSVIMSASADDLDDLWEPFLDSLSVTDA